VSDTLYELTVEEIAAGGDGIARLDSGRVVFVPRTAPGDRVVARLTESRARWARGQVVEIRVAGSGRVEPTCEYYPECGGCGVQHLDGPTQIAAMRRGIEDALARIGRSDVPVRPIEPATERLGYRNRVTYTVRRDKGEVIAGYHRLRGPRLLDVETCPLAEPAVSEAWRALRAAWGKGASALPAGREIRVTLRGSAAGEVTLWIEGGTALGDPARVLEAVPSLRSYWWKPSGGSRQHLGGEPVLRERWDDLDVPLLPKAFLQVNRRISVALERHLDEVLGSVAGLRILDLYAGVGLRAIRWASRGADVITVESGRDAVETGRAVAESVGVAVDGRRSRVEESLGSLGRADVIVLNPPRAGISKAAAEMLVKAPADRLVYISCDAATLARDIRRMSDAWVPVFAQPFDAFPQTGHVETVLWLARSAGQVDRSSASAPS